MTMIGLSNDEILGALLAMLAIAIVAAAGVVAARFLGRSRAPGIRVEEHPKLIPKLSSDALAGLIVQALVDNKFVAAEKFEDAAQVAARKIDLRKALGDY